MRAKTLVGWAAAFIVATFVVAAATQNSATPSQAADAEMTEDHKRTLTALIQLQGYVCPKVKIATMLGPEPRGHAFRAYCGPADREGVFPNLKYRAIVRSEKEWLVEPWK